MTFYDYLKNIFWILIILSLAPTLFTNLAKQYGHIFIKRARVGVLPMKAVLADSTAYCKNLRYFFEDNSIKAILIKMECPGGASGTAQAISYDLIALKKEHPKPVVVLVENVCASGGYLIASAADYIICPSSALIGSIGSAMPYLFKVNKLIDNWHVDYTPIAAGKYKNATNPFAPMNQDDINLLQGVTTDCYDQFVFDVSKNRNLSVDKKADWAEAKIFTGRQALKLGLVDEIGAYDAAIKSLRKKAHIPDGVKIEWVCPPKQRTFWSFFTDDSDVCSDDTSVLSRFASTLCDKMEERLRYSGLKQAVD